MLHELLLSLSGHPSPLLHSHSAGTKDGLGPFQSLLSPAERALLQSLSEDLGSKHRSVRDGASRISVSHGSTICRAVATAVVSTHLERFQRRILEVEKDILSESPSIVGAYNIVPLSTVVGAFDGWGRKLAWLWDLVQYVQDRDAHGNPRPGHEAVSACTAAELMQWLRDASRTGWPDVERMSLDLIGVAEMAWLKQVSAWVLYGQHPGAADFFVTREGGQSGLEGAAPAYRITSGLVPCFVTPSTANSIFFIGRSLKHIKERRSSTAEQPHTLTAPELALLPAHLAQLSALKTPISSASFSAAVGAIRLSLSQNALQQLLPISKVLEMLHVLKDFFLLERGEFAIALITAADDRLSLRHQRGARGPRPAPKDINDLASLTIRDGEVHSVLARTWTALAALQSVEDDGIDEGLDRARELITLSIKTLGRGPTSLGDGASQRPPSTVSFDDLLLPSSTALGVRVPSPLDLFLTPSDVDTYSIIHAYLLAIRRAHFRLSKLFLLSALRRDRPLKAATRSNPRHPPPSQDDSSRQRVNRRTRAMRPIWATIGSAAFFLAELGEYFQGEVVQGSWDTFHRWLVPPVADLARPDGSSSLASSLRPGSSYVDSRPSSSRRSDDDSAATYGIHDPESLTHAHRSYLASLRRAILLDDANFASQLRRQMTAIDHLSALMQRLDTVQQSLHAAEPPPPHLAAEEHTLLLDLQSSRAKVAGGVQGLIACLRDIDDARAGGGRYGPLPGQEQRETDFVPRSSGALDRLLLKFDDGRVEDFAPSRFVDDESPPSLTS